MAKNDGLLIFGLLGAILLGAGGFALVSGFFKKNGNGIPPLIIPPTPSVLTQPVVFEYPDLSGLYDALASFGSQLGLQNGKKTTTNGRARVYTGDIETSYQNGVLVSKIKPGYALHETLRSTIQEVKASNLALEESAQALQEGSKEAVRRIRRTRPEIVRNLQSLDRQKRQALQRMETARIKRATSPWNPLNQ